MSVWSVQPIDSMGISIDWFPLIVPAVAKIAKLVYSSNNYGLWVHDNPITSNYYSIWRAICCFLFFSRQVLIFWVGSWFYAFLFLCFSAFLLSAFLLLCFHCFSAFPASLLFLLLCLFWFSAVSFPCFCAFLLLCFPGFSAVLLLCLATSTIYFFCSSVMRFCCSTSCSFASLLPVFLSLCLSFSFALFCSVCILNETLERP